MTPTIIVWSGRVEIDGVFRSLTVGHLDALRRVLYDPDIHAVTIAATQPKRSMPARHAMCLQQHLGKPGSPWASGEMAAAYARGLMVKADDPGVCSPGGETTTGERGTCLRTQTSGRLGRSCHSRPSKCDCVGPCHASR